MAARSRVPALQSAVLSGRRRPHGGILPVAVCALGLGACATVPQAERPWGEAATARPGWQRVGEAAAAALGSPGFWAPLAGALLLQVDGLDRRVSNWARRRTPLFGSEQNAVAWSDRLRSASGFAYFATVAATPGAAGVSAWLLDKAQGTAAGLAAIAATDEESALLKSAAARERPNGQDRQSMPSSHASRSAVLTELGRLDLEWTPLAAPVRHALDFGLTALTLGTEWARVEAGFHYPSDTLVGMALGDFNGRFFNDAFLAPAPPHLALVPMRGGAQLQLRMAF